MKLRGNRRPLAKTDSVYAALASYPVTLGDNSDTRAAVVRQEEASVGPSSWRELKRVRSTGS